MKRVALLTLFLCSCTSGRLPASYAVILDPSLGELSYTVQKALRERLPNAEFMQSVLPADKHEAIVLVRGECNGPCGTMRPTTYAYEIYRGESVVRRGRISADAGYDGGAYGSKSVDASSVGLIAPKTLASHIARDLGKI